MAVVQLPFIMLLNMGPHSHYGYIGYFFYFLPLVLLDKILGPEFALEHHLFLFEGVLFIIQWMVLCGIVYLLAKAWNAKRS